jgi:hypothetical protein
MLPPAHTRTHSLWVCKCGAAIEAAPPQPDSERRTAELERVGGGTSNNALLEDVLVMGTSVVAVLAIA